MRKKLYRRRQTRDGNKLLYKIAGKKGLKNFDRFTNAGYRGCINLMNVFFVVIMMKVD